MNSIPAEKVRCDLMDSLPVENVRYDLMDSFPEKVRCDKEGLTALFPLKLSFDYTPCGCPANVSGIIISAV